MSELTEKAQAALDRLVASATADLKAFADDVGDDAMDYVKEALMKIAKYTLAAELESDEGEKEGYRHNIRAVVSSAASEVSIKTAETRNFVEGLLTMAKAALTELIPKLI